MKRKKGPTPTQIQRKKRARLRRRLNWKLKRALSMQIEQLGSIGPAGGPPEVLVYEVTGERKHLIYTSATGTVISCDCKNHAAPCSHVIRYQQMVQATAKVGINAR